MHSSRGLDQAWPRPRPGLTLPLWLLNSNVSTLTLLICFSLTRRAVHITAVTKSHLFDDFHCQTADADEVAQDEVLNGLTTYLIWPEDQEDPERPANRLNIIAEVGNSHVASMELPKNWAGARRCRPAAVGLDRYFSAWPGKREMVSSFNLTNAQPIAPFLPSAFY